VGDRRNRASPLALPRVTATSGKDSMDIIGHIAVLDHAGVSGDIWGDDATLALFPNLAHCHDWGYRQLQAGTEPRERVESLIRGHILADWVIHYGVDVTAERRRIGWAYQEAPAVIERMDTFFDHVLASGVTDVDPRHLDDRSHLERDFGHTVAECALDLQLAESVSGTARDTSVRASLSRLADPDFAVSLTEEVFRFTGGTTSEPPEVLARTAREYGAWATDVRTLHDFAALTICTKLGWPFNREAVDLVLGFLADVAARLQPAASARLVDRVVELVDDTCRRVAD
jgi:hypothetical protein